VHWKLFILLLQHFLVCVCVGKDWIDNEGLSITPVPISAIFNLNLAKRERNTDNGVNWVRSKGKDEIVAIWSFSPLRYLFFPITTRTPAKFMNWNFRFDVTNEGGRWAALDESWNFRSFFFNFFPSLYRWKSFFFCSVRLFRPTPFHFHAAALPDGARSCSRLTPFLYTLNYATSNFHFLFSCYMLQYLSNINGVHACMSFATAAGRDFGRKILFSSN
jgi:hypothetical protein